MAVRLDAQTLLSAVGQDLAARSRDLDVAVLEAADGGAFAVADGFHVWVGVVNGELIGDCDCLADELCEHAVAVAVAALEQGLEFASIPARDERGPEERRFTAAAARIGRRELLRIVGNHAAADRRLAVQVLVAAGELGAPEPEEIAAVTKVVRAAADIPNGRSRWELHDLITAGQRVVAEIELLAFRPFTVDTLDVADEAVATWAKLLIHLGDGWRSVDPQPISDALADLHLRLCEAADLEPDELVDRLRQLLQEFEDDGFLDIDAYAELLGEEFGNL